MAKMYDDRAEIKGWPILDHGGKTYAMNSIRCVVWRRSSRCTGCHHWVLVRNPPEGVRDALLIARGEP